MRKGLDIFYIGKKKPMYTLIQQKDKDFLDRHSFFSALSFYLKNSRREISRRKTFYCLALFSCALVVMTTAVAQTVVDNAPLIFLKQAERTAGEIDVQLASHSYKRNDPFDQLPLEIEKLFELESPVRQKREILLNGSQIEAVNQESIHAHTSYRYLQKIRLIGGREHNSSCLPALGPDFRSSYEELYDPQVMVDCTYKIGNLLVLNTKRENEIGLGTTVNEPIPEGSAIIDKNIAELLGISVGDYFLMQFYVDSHMEYIAEENEDYFRENTKRRPQDVSNIFIRIVVKVHDVWPNFADKLPNGGKSYILMEQESFYRHAVKFFSNRWNPILKNTTEFFKSKLVSLDLMDYSNSIIINHPQRMKIYTDSNYDNLQFTIEKFADKVSMHLGVLPFDMKLDLLRKLEPLKFAVLFLGILLNIVIIVLFGQSVMVIYNLLLVKVETKTFEMGVLRTLGLNNAGIIELILVQTLIFVLPAIAIGLLSSIPFLGGVSAFLKDKLGADVDAKPSAESILYACMVGLLVPVISSIAPIVAALGKPLNDALDTLHSKATSVFVDIQLSSKKIPWPTVTFSLLTIAFGMSVYYLLPLSLVSFNIGLMLSVFFWILLGMLLGLVMLSMNIQHLVERLVVSVLLCFASQSFRGLVVKNLVTHKLRNRKTATMYALTLGFIIFLVVGYKTNIESFEIMNKQYAGAHLEVTLRDICDNPPGNGEYLQLDKFMHSSNMSEYVHSFAWVTCGLREVIKPSGFQGLEVLNIGKMYSEEADVFGVTPNIFDITLNEFYKPGVISDSSGRTPVHDLYSLKGSQAALVSDHFRKSLELNLDHNSTYLLKLVNGSYSKTHEFRMIGSMKMSPSFGFQLERLVNMLISIPTFMRLAGGNIKDYTELPMHRLLIKLKDENRDTAEETIRKIVTFCNENGIGVRTWNYYELSEALKKNDQAIQGIFASIEIISMMLCLFSLITTMSSNILEQSKEIAVLRAIGVEKKTVVRLYCAEAVVLVTASSFLGGLIGAVVGWSMSEQRAILTKLPIGFQFPWLQMFVVVVVATVSGVLSSYFPAKSVCSNQIAQIVRLLS
mgnify:FL=1